VSFDQTAQHERSDLIWIKALDEYNGSFIALALICKLLFFATWRRDYGGNASPFHSEWAVANVRLAPLQRRCMADSAKSDC